MTVCPACGAVAFSKQLTAAGFQLKGSGWYATDFRNGSSTAPAADKPADKTADKPAEKSADSGAGKSDAATAPAKSDAPSASAGGCGASCACH